MKVYSVSNIGLDDKFTRHLVNLTIIGYFQRTQFIEFTKFTSRTVVDRVGYGRHSVTKGEFVVHVFKSHSGLTAAMITDKEYPERVAQAYLFDNINNGDNTVIDWNVIQDPVKFDRITRVQSDLNDTMLILHNTIEGILERGERLNDLVERSSDLSVQSKIFYKTARKNNSCCVVT